MQSLARLRLFPTNASLFARRVPTSSRNATSIQPRAADVFVSVNDAPKTSPLTGVCPIENSTNGPVLETQDCLHEFSVREIAREKLKIGHALLRRRETLADVPVERIYSHEQVRRRLPVGACSVTNERKLTYATRRPAGLRPVQTVYRFTLPRRRSDSHQIHCSRCPESGVRFSESRDIFHTLRRGLRS